MGRPRKTAEETGTQATPQEADTQAPKTARKGAPRKTRAQLIREGNLQKGRKMTPYERTRCIQFRLHISRKEEQNGVVVTNFKREREPFIRIEAALDFVRNLGKGYVLSIANNPKKWLAGENTIGLYDMVEKVEEAVNVYNNKTR